MQRRSLLVSMFVAAASTGTVQAQQLAWQTIAGAEGRYSFDIPTPIRQTQSTGAFDSIIRQYLFEWGSGRYGLDMTIIELDPRDPDHPATDVGVLLKNGQSNVQKRWPGSTVLQQGEISLGPAQGRAFKLSLEGGRLVLTGRVYFLNARLYLQIALTPPEEQSSAAVMRFMDSLRIVR